MKIFFITIVSTLLFLMPLTTVAAQNTSNGQNGNTSVISTQNQTHTQTQTQIDTAATGTQIQLQEQTENKIQERISECTPTYSPNNSVMLQQRNTIMSVNEQLIRAAARLENQELGDQIRNVTAIHTQNQDKIGQSIDKAEQRSGFAKFFIGANYQELNNAKAYINENRNQIRVLEQVMAQLTSDTDKIVVAEQIIALQNIELELEQQISDISEGFSLFGWLNRLFNRF